MSDTAVLQLDDVVKKFGGLTAVDRVGFSVRRGQIKALIGPNGAGKTTVFNLITGVYNIDAGEIRIAGHVTSGRPSHRIASRGIARTFQHVELFSNMTVLENVMVGAHMAATSGMLASALHLHSMKAQERLLADKAASCLDLVGLDVPYDTDALSLAFGQQRLLEVARALAADPILVLLDEPAAGLSSAESAQLAELVQRIRDLEVTVLIVDHDMDLVMRISDEVVVLDHGVKIAEGTPKEIQANSEVIAAYLGEEI